MAWCAAVPKKYAPITVMMQIPARSISATGNLIRHAVSIFQMEVVVRLRKIVLSTQIRTVITARVLITNADSHQRTIAQRT